MSRAKAAGILLAVLLCLAALVDAQVWSGPARVGVRVRNERGRPLPAALVTLRYTEVQPVTGPPAVETGSNGVVEIRGLAPGRWVLEVSHPGFMSYVATLRLEEGGKAEALFEAMQKSGESLIPLVVKLFEPRPGPPTFPAPGDLTMTPPAAPEARPAPEEPPPERLPEPAAEPPAEEAPPPAAESPAPASPPVEDAPPPVAEPPAQASPPVEESPPPAAEPPAPASPPAEEAPPPVAEPPAMASPQAAPAPPPAPRVFATLRSFRDGGCVECKRGEWAVSAEQMAGAAGGSGAPACAGGPDPTIAEAVRLLAGSNLELAAYAGPLLLAERPAAATDPEAAARLRDLLASRTDPAAPCQLVALLLPKGARYIGYQFEAADAADRASCLAGKDCLDGRGRWLADPVVEKGAAATVIYATFENRSPRGPLRPRLTAYFVPPSPEWAPSP